MARLGLPAAKQPDAPLILYREDLMRRWPHFDHIFFDCDSTLSAVEGIDILAESTGQQEQVETLTNAAMNGQVDLDDVYEQRLRAVSPSRQQVRDIRRAYKKHIVEDAARVIATLHALGHHVYIISGGLAEPVTEFAVYLGIPRHRVRAVDLSYDELSGRWWERASNGNEQYLAYQSGALTVSNGKATIVADLLGDQRGRSLLIGDGTSDLLAGSAVDLFVGYGGVATRPRVLDEAPVFLHSRSLAPVLALAGGPAALRQARTWTMAHQTLATKTRYLIQTGAITFKDEQLETRFAGAFGLPQQSTR